MLEAESLGFSGVELDYVPPLDADGWSTDPLAPFVSVRWLNDSESNPTLDTPGVWTGTLVIDLINVSGYDARRDMIDAVNDAVDAIVGLFMADPDLGGHCINAWCASVTEKPTDVMSKWNVKTCQIMVSVQSEPEEPDVEE